MAATKEQIAEVEASNGTLCIVVDAQGTRVEPIPQSTIDRREKVLQKESVKAARSNDILAMLAPSAQTLVEEREIEVGDEKRIFYIKRFSHSDISKLDAKKYRRGPNQQLIKDVEQEEVVGTAWQLHMGVVQDANESKTNSQGEALLPRWESVFSLEDILGGKDKIGLMNNPNPQAQELIEQLVSAIWDVNPRCNPLAMAVAMNQMGLG